MLYQKSGPLSNAAAMMPASNRRRMPGSRYRNQNSVPIPLKSVQLMLNNLPEMKNSVLILPRRNLQNIKRYLVL